MIALAALGFVPACGPTTPPPGRDAAPPDAPPPGNDARTTPPGSDAAPPDDITAPPNDATTPPPPDATAPTPDGGPPPRDSGVPRTGTIPLTLEADRGAAANAVVSLGVPFAPGVLRADTDLALRDPGGTEVPVRSSVLARWPGDGSVRSVGLVFRATLAAGARATYQLAYGAPRGATLMESLAPNPDGPVAATLPATWYTTSLVSGPHVTGAANRRFAMYDAALERAITSMSPPYESYTSNCGSTTAHRTYYDGPHGLYQRFVRYGDAARYRRARTEATWFRANELRWLEGRAMAVHVCQAAGWTPAVALDWSVIRRMTGQGNLDDYLLTGDPAAREAVVGMGEAFRRNVPALTAGATPTVEITERNMGWTIMGLAAYYAVDSRAEVLTALRALVDRTIAWQARGTSGAFEHDIVRPDPTECSRGPRGASPFMTSLLVDGLMDYWQLTGDARLADVLRRVATWYERSAITSDGRAFRYLWNCETNPYDDSSGADLNLLINHVFGAAYALTGEARWLTFGDRMADHGIAAIYVGRPKQWNQAARSFGRYMGYRAATLAP